ncbi:TLR1-like protein [Mya arenaria]|uniref:TLR1-like protein n=1 Tax=Mya arenaria TaxID=6604 RepID=A0ABY7FYK2_MYAAR|nr:TLR1-like protein [Mya arenaria]
MAEVENTRRKHSVIPQLPLDKRYHVFVCYVKENVNDVRTIVGNLEKAGLKCCYHERDFIPGQRTWDNMHAKIKESMHMLVVLSEDFSRSHFAKQELYEADVAESTEDLNIIPLKIESCDVPAILKNKTYIDCENNDITEIHYKIIEAVIDNGQKTRLKEEDSGEAFSISTYQKPGFRLLPRYKLEFVAEMRDKILMKSKDLFIRKCEQRDDFQKRRCEGESLDDYADRMFDRFLRSKKINLLDIPHSHMKVRVKRLTLFRGRHGSSARLKLYPEDEETVEDNSLWPENVTWRRWVSKQEWEREREESRQRRRDHLRHQPYRPYHRYDASYNKRQHRVEDTSSRDNDRNSPWYSDRDDYHDVDEWDPSRD